MNRRNRSILLFFVPLALLAFFAPNVLACLLVFCAAILYTSFLDRFCRFLSSKCSSLKPRLKMKFIKGPNSIFLIGAMLSLAFIAIGFTWGNANLAYARTFQHLVSLATIVSHLLCLTVFAGMVKVLALAPDFRNETAGKARLPQRSR